MIVGPPVVDRLGPRRRIGDPVVRAVVAEQLALRRAPHPGDDRQLLLEDVEPLADRRKRDAVGGVFGFVPAGAEAEIDAAATHRVDGRDRDRERSRLAERGRADQRAQPNARGLDRESGQRRPRVGRTRPAVHAAHVQVVVGAEEAVESTLLGAEREPAQVVVGGALLRLVENADVQSLVHGATFSGDRNSRAPGPPGRRSEHRRDVRRHLGRAARRGRRPPL